jgi:hypothetical protein
VTKSKKDPDAACVWVMDRGHIVPKFTLVTIEKKQPKDYCEN